MPNILNLKDLYKYQSHELRIFKYPSAWWCIELTLLGGGMAPRTEIVRGPPNKTGAHRPDWLAPAQSRTGWIALDKYRIEFSYHVASQTKIQYCPDLIMMKLSTNQFHLTLSDHLMPFHSQSLPLQFVGRGISIGPWYITFHLYVPSY